MAGGAGAHRLRDAQLRLYRLGLHQRRVVIEQFGPLDAQVLAGQVPVPLDAGVGRVAVEDGAHG
jgi:hypothetical protein